ARGDRWDCRPGRLGDRHAVGANGRVTDDNRAARAGGLTTWPAGHTMSKYSVEDFLAACGATGPLRLSVEHPGGADQYLLQQPFAVVGRDPRADLRVADSNAARRHLYLQVLCGRLLCLDLTKSSPDGRR